jgi:hypothetical protein
MDALGFFDMVIPYTFGVLALVMCCLSLHGDSPTSKHLPPGVLKALALAEKAYCDHFEDKTGCHRTFRGNLAWHELVIAPSGQTAFLVENRESCGSAGCALSLFLKQPDAKYVQVLGTGGEIGTLESVSVLKTVTGDHYNIQKTWHDRKTQTLYLWDGLRYSAQPSPD